MTLGTPTSLHTSTNGKRSHFPFVYPFVFMTEHSMLLINNVEEESVLIVGLQRVFEVYTESMEELCGLHHVNLDR